MKEEGCGDGRLTQEEIKQVEKTISGRIGMLEESPGVRSIRRVLALIFAIAAIGLFALGGIIKDINAIYGGGASALVCVLMLFFTTWSDVAGAVAKVTGKGV